MITLPRAGTLIPPGMQPYVTEQALANNAQGYDEMQWQPGEQDMIRIARVMDHLRSVPLVHTTNLTKDSYDAIQLQGLRSHADLGGEQASNSYALDKSLWLHEFVFTHIGQLGVKLYGQDHILIKAEALHGDCVVTPRDITHSLGRRDYQHRPFTDLPTITQGDVQRGFFDRMVTGSAWQEILARRIVRKLGANPYQAYTLRLNEMTLGEVKYRQNLPASYLTGEVVRANPLQHADAYEAAEAFRQRMLSLGFAYNTSYFPGESNSEWRHRLMLESQQAYTVWRKLLRV